MKHRAKKSRVAPKRGEVDTNNPNPAAAPTKIANLNEDCLQLIISRVAMCDLFKSVKPVCEHWQGQHVRALDARQHLILHEEGLNPEDPRLVPPYKQYFPRLLSEKEIQRYGLSWSKIDKEILEKNFRFISHLSIFKENVNRAYFTKLFEVLEYFKPRLTSLKVYWTDWYEKDGNFVLSSMSSLFEAISKLDSLTRLELVLELPLNGNFKTMKAITIPSTVTFLRLEIDADPKDEWLCSSLSQLVETNPNIEQIYARFQITNLRQLDPNSAKKLTKLAIVMDPEVGMAERVKSFSRLPSVTFLRMDHVYTPLDNSKDLLSGIHALEQLKHVEVDLSRKPFHSRHDAPFHPAASVRKLTVITDCADRIRDIEQRSHFPNIERCEVMVNFDSRRFSWHDCHPQLEQLFRNTHLQTLKVNGKLIEPPPPVKQFSTAPYEWDPKLIEESELYLAKP